jgi:hypothetical protein
MVARLESQSPLKCGVPGRKILLGTENLGHSPVFKMSWTWLSMPPDASIVGHAMLYHAWRAPAAARPPIPSAHGPGMRTCGRGALLEELGTRKNGQEQTQQLLHKGLACLTNTSSTKLKFRPFQIHCILLQVTPNGDSLILMSELSTYYHHQAPEN